MNKEKSKLDGIFEDFLSDLEGDKKSIHTINNYRNDLTYFQKYLKRKKLNVMKMKIVDLNKMKNELGMEAFADSTIARRVTCVKSFYNYLRANELIKENPALNFKSPSIAKKEPLFMNMSEVKRLVNATKGETHEIRDRLILMMFITTGVRLSELEGIDLEHISEDNFIKIKGKGNVERKVFIVDGTKKLLEDYLQIRGKKGGALFLTDEGNRLRKRSIQYTVKKYIEMANLNENLSVHKLRHTSATIMLENNIDIRTIQEILGHSNIKTTQKYTHVTKQRKIDAGAIMSKQFADII